MKIEKVNNLYFLSSFNRGGNQKKQVEMKKINLLIMLAQRIITKD